jgi:putative DNA primase/helicase
MQVARQFLDGVCTFDGSPTLRHWRGGWWMWLASYWEEMDERTMRSLLYKFTENAAYLDEKGKAKPWAPNRKRISDLSDALSAISILANSLDQPCWLNNRDSGTIVATANGLLDIKQSLLYPHSPLFFNLTAVPFDYDPYAKKPEQWLWFLNQLWPDDHKAIDALGEWNGYVISGRTDLQKIFMTIGPTRGGKGILARMLGKQIGKRNVCGPTLSSLAGEFGLAPMIGKNLAVISDARGSKRLDVSVVVERLLSISGEDTLTVNRKYKEQWTGKLAARLHIISNELPRLGDASGAIIGRLVLLVLTESWLGREDHELEDKLTAELPGILNWSLDGLRRLIKNDGRFTRSAGAAEALVTMTELASPVAAFVREKCVLKNQIGHDDLYAAYKLWCEDNGHTRSPKTVFGRDLKAAFPSIKTIRPWADGKDRTRIYVGIRLRSVDDDEANEQRSNNVQNLCGLSGLNDHEEAGSPHSPHKNGSFPLHPSGLGRCVQCNGPEADAPLVMGKEYPPAGVHLHEQCRKFWLRHNRVSRERFRKVTETLPGTHCVHCHKPDGEVWRIKDGHVVGGQSEPLHEHCASRFFRAGGGGEP